MNYHKMSEEETMNELKEICKFFNKLSEISEEEFIKSEK